MRYWFAAALVLAGCGETRAPEKKAPPAAVAAKILHFYASPGEIRRGEHTLICYGVDNARAVRIEPPVEPLKPLFNRCFPVTPAGTSKFELIAEGMDGAEKRESFTVRVAAAAPAAAAPAAERAGLIEFFIASPNVTRPGSSVSLCYSAPEAQSIRIEPDLGLALPEKKGCALVRPEKTTTYRLIAQSAGRRDQAELSVKVD